MTQVETVEEAKARMESKLKILDCKRETMFAKINTTYELSKRVVTFDSRSNEQFLSASETIEESVERFERILDEINEIKLKLLPASTPSYQELIAFEDLVSVIKRVRQRIKSSEKSVDVDKSHGLQTCTKIKLPSIELPSFDGTTENWPRFYESFRANVHENAELSDAQRVQYLVSKLTHSAQKVLAGIVPTGDTYKILWNSLVEKYQDIRALGTHYLNNIFDLKPCQNTAISLDAFIGKYAASISALKQLDIQDLCDFVLMHCALKKLDIQTVQAFESAMKDTAIPSYCDLISFVQKQVKILERSYANNSSSLSSSRVRFCANKPTSSVRGHTFVTSNEKPPNGFQYCILCNKVGHLQLDECAQFKGMNSPQARFNFIKSKQGCVNCLSVLHSVSACTMPANCKLCKTKWHHTLLHFEAKNEGKKTTVKTNTYIQTGGKSDVGLLPSTSSAFTPALVSPQSSAMSSAPSVSMNIHSRMSTILLATAQVFAWSNNIRDKVLVRCLIDNGSQNHLMTLECCNRMNLHIFPLNNSVIKGIGLSAQPIHGYVNFEIQSRYDPQNKYTLKAFVVNCITDKLPTSLINKTDMSYINNLSMADLTWNVPGNVDIVLGAQLFPYIYLGHKKESGTKAPPAVLTSFGYVLMGDCANSTTATVMGHEPFSAFAMNDLDPLLQRFWELEEVPLKRLLSPDETECENLFLASVSRDETGRYSSVLPFCVNPDNLGNSRNTALRRFLSLEKKFKQIASLKDNYSAVINEYIKKGYLVAVTESDINTHGYYIPHHAVVREDKPMPRIVLDASAKTHTGLSLNDVLHAGPNLQADLFRLLLNFRLFPVAMTADVQQMYLQVGVCIDHRRYLRILFRFSENEEIQTFQFNRLPFGLKCSPYIAMRSLRKLASDMADVFPEAAKVIESKFYMDDLVHSVVDEGSAVCLANDLISLFRSGCMDLVKWSSNSSFLRDSVSNSHRNSIQFDEDVGTSQKVLGLSWDPIEDIFFFTTKDCQQKCTKRSILSVVARLFDVLGLVAPVILFAKLLIKELWLAKINWDDTPTEKIVQNFLTLTQELPLLATLKIPRHVGVTGSTEVLVVGFCDASLSGYGCVIYLHTTDTSGSSSVRLLCSKSKVSPTKISTLARLELCAAVLLSKLIRIVIDTYSDRLQIADVYAFSDSTIALSWICSSPHRWSIFVGNRVAQCQENLPSHNFYHVSGLENPSDCVSRGLLPSQLISNSLWWTGPQWLKRPSSEWPVKKFIPSNAVEMPEHKAIILMTTANRESSILSNLSRRISSWDKLIRITVYILRFVNKIKSLSNFIECMSKAETKLIQAVQIAHFSDDIKLLKNKELPSKKLRSLSVFIDTEGILRVGGRLSKSDLPFEARHPAVLPKHDPVVNLIIIHFHTTNCHTGPGLLMSIIRQKYWILDARTVIRARCRECNICFRVNPSHLTPKMADLPAFRITEAKAFVHTGVDYAGPLRILLTRRRGQHAQKAYICLFVCLVTKAVHIELATELSSICFLSAFKRFISRRGPVSCMYSDNGTNFVGAQAQLDEMYNLLFSSAHNEKIRKQLESYRIDWKMIPPRAPHFGGLWESSIKSLKTHLYRVIGSQLLTYEEMETVLTQIECILNSRPLGVVSSDPHPEIISPAHFLMSTPLKYLPTSDLPDMPVNLVHRKNLLDHIVSSYWKRWRMEYLHTLQVRQKWLKDVNSIQVGTVVLLGQDDIPPLSWPLGIITEVFPGTDGIVRVATVKTNQGSYKRPVVKLYPLPSQ